MFHLMVAEDIELHLLEEKDAEEVFARIDANREHLRKWMSWVDGTETIEDTRKFRKKALQEYAEGTSLPSGVFCGGQLVGMIGCKIDRANRTGKIGYWLAEEHQGRGIMTRACHGLIQYGFAKLGLNRMEIRVAPENRRSRAIAERLGFRQEGILREAQWLYDRYVDLVVYGMLAMEWEDKQVS